MNSVYTAADEKKAAVLVGLDLSAAFDTINHDVLISRLESQFGVDGSASSWLRSYLTDRQQFVKLGIIHLPRRSAPLEFPKGQCSDHFSSERTCRRSVEEVIESHGVSYRQFAEDTQLLVAMNVTDAGSALERIRPRLRVTTLSIYITTFIKNGESGTHA